MAPWYSDSNIYLTSERKIGAYFSFTAKKF